MRNILNCLKRRKSNLTKNTNYVIIHKNKRENILVRVKKEDEVLECLGVWKTGKPKLFHMIAYSANTAIGFRDDEPFLPTGKIVGSKTFLERLHLKKVG